MANTTQMLQGNTVYGSGSFAPNTGHVSAQGVQGYLQREMSSKRTLASSVGGDGQSDTRSGAAASLRDRLNSGSNQGPTYGQQATPGGGPNPYQTNTYAAPTPTGSPLYSSTVTAAAKPAAVPTGVTGKLSLPGNIDYANSVLGAYSSLSAQLNQNYNDAVANEAEYANNMYGLNKEYAKQQGVTRAAQGGQGTLYSSANVNAVRKDLENYSSQANEQQTAYQNNRNAFTNNAQTIKNSWTGQLQQASRDDAQKKAEEAKARAAAEATKKAANTKSNKQASDKAAGNVKKFDKSTKNALNNFKKANGLPTDGVLGHVAMGKLKEAAKDPKNYRAKWLLAAAQGNTKAANKYKKLRGKQVKNEQKGKPKPKPKPRPKRKPVGRK